jgi:DNA-directed RNA polymerase subunit L
MFSKFSKDKNVSSFTISDIDLSIVNSLRRTILADIQNVAFYFDINNREPEKADIYIKTNDTPLHNEFLAQRLSMIPIHVLDEEIKSWNPSEYEFSIDITNESNKSITVTSENIIVKKNGNTDEKLRERMFPKNAITGDYILITKLPPSANKATHLMATMIAKQGTAEKSACWSTISLCTYFNNIDESKNSKKKDEYVEKHKDTLSKEHAIARYNTLDYQRAYKRNEYFEPNEFIFKIEPECLLSVSTIVHNGLSILSDKIQTLIKFDDEKISIDKSDDVYNITINEENHTIGNLLQALLYNIHVRENKSKDISFVGYFVPHPLDKRLILKIKSSFNEFQIKEELIHSFNRIKIIIEDVLKNWDTFSSKEQAIN